MSDWWAPSALSVLRSRRHSGRSVSDLPAPSVLRTHRQEGPGSVPALRLLRSRLRKLSLPQRQFRTLQCQLQTSQFLLLTVQHLLQTSQCLPLTVQCLPQSSQFLPLTEQRLPQTSKHLLHSWRPQPSAYRTLLKQNRCLQSAPPPLCRRLSPHALLRTDFPQEHPDRRSPPHLSRRSLRSVRYSADSPPLPQRQ